jgi:hypothetical protein
MTKGFSLKLLKNYNCLKYSNILSSVDTTIEAYISISHLITLRMYKGV